MVLFLKAKQDFPTCFAFLLSKSYKTSIFGASVGVLPCR